MSKHESLSDFLDRADRRAEEDACRYEALDGDLCQLCHAHGADKRTLLLRYLYAIHEVVPEAIDLRKVEGREREGYMLRTCKACRGRFLDMMARWRDECVGLRGHPKDHDGDLLGDPVDGLVPVRRNGRTVYVTEEEWRADP